MMGGKIWVESEPGLGSAFHFTSRFEVNNQPALLFSPKSRAKLRGMSVLVVDDNATNRKILEETLQHWQMRPTAVDSGPAALGVLEDSHSAGRQFPLMLIDGHMPDMDGFRLVELIKTDPRFSSVTVMMISSVDQHSDLERCRRLGIQTYLTKPIKQSELFVGITRALNLDVECGEVLERNQETSEETTREAALETLPPLRILLAEDNAVNQRVTAGILEKRGHEIVLANNGREALQSWESQPFDIILMDVQMPEMDGFETTAMIRRREKELGRRTPIIALTARAMKGDRDYCLEAGMDGYLSKPIQPRELLKTIQEVLPAGVKNRNSRGATPPACGLMFEPISQGVQMEVPG
jgi:CheY-like chemotaxis protein